MRPYWLERLRTERDIPHITRVMVGGLNDGA